MRVRSIDSFKAVAIFAVVCIHSTSLVDTPVYWQIINQISRFAVAYFFVISAYFFTLSYRRGEPIGKLLLRYLVRIGIAFFAWSTFYGFVVPLLEGRIPHHLSEVCFFNWIRYPHAFLLRGGFFHLWFLSSLAQGLVLLALFLKIKRPGLWLCCAMSLFVVGLLAGSYSKTPLGIPWPSRVDPWTGPFFCALFVYVGSWLASSDYRPNTRTAILLCSGGMLLQLGEAAFLKYRFGMLFTGHSFLVGTVPFALGIALLALSRPEFGVAAGLDRIGRYSLGIYVLHPFVMITAKSNLPWLVQAPPVFAILSFAITTLIVLLLARQRRLAFLVT